MVFVKKLNFSPSVFWGQLKPEKMFFYILDRNECVLDQKSEILKISKKEQFSKGFSPWFLSKNRNFYHVCLLGKSSQTTSFLVYSGYKILWTKQSDLSKKYKESKFSERGRSMRFVNNWPPF